MSEFIQMELCAPKFIQAQRRKRKGAFFSVETAFYFIVIAIVAALVIGIFTFLDDARVSTAQQELDQIRSAALEYKAYRLDQNLPETGNLPVLLSDSAITAEESIDNRQHGPFLNTTSNRWTSEALLDPWGNPYDISPNNDDEEAEAYVWSTAGNKDEPRWIKSYINADPSAKS